MARYDGGWPAYVPVARRRQNAAREIARRRKAGQVVAPVQITGRAIATTAWGKAWCDNLESYRDYETRLPRGRTYVRNGSVIDLQIAPQEIQALVSGSEIYRVRIRVEPISKPLWKSICADCTGRIESLVELLQGRLAKGVMERLCRQGQGLFPRPAEVRFSCSCPDHALMCKHVAAVLYGVGARLDQEPELLFRLRAVDGNDLIADLSAALPGPAARPAGRRVLGDTDVAALFGLDIVDPGNSTLEPAKGTDGAPSGEIPQGSRPARRPAASKPKPRIQKRTSGAGAAKHMAKRPEAAGGKARSRPALSSRPPSAKNADGAAQGTAAKKVPNQKNQATVGNAPTKPAVPRPAEDKPVKWSLPSRPGKPNQTRPSRVRKRR